MSTWDPGKEVRRGLIGRCTQNHHWGRQGEQLGWVEEWRRKPALETPAEASVTPQKSPRLPFP